MTNYESRCELRVGLYAIGHRSHSTTEENGSRNHWGGKGAKKRFKLVRSDGPKDLPIAPQRRSAQRRQRPAAPPPPRSHKARPGSEEGHLAFTANILHHVDGRGRSKPEGCTRTDATRSHLPPLWTSMRSTFPRVSGGRLSAR